MASSGVWRRSDLKSEVTCAGSREGEGGNDICPTPYPPPPPKLPPLLLLVVASARSFLPLRWPSLACGPPPCCCTLCCCC